MILTTTHLGLRGFGEADKVKKGSGCVLLHPAVSVFLGSLRNSVPPERGPPQSQPYNQTLNLGFTFVPGPQESHTLKVLNPRETLDLGFRVQGELQTPKSSAREPSAPPSRNNIGAT